jgi:hypothetical protein
VRCWRCNDRNELDDFGLCDECLERLASEETTIAPGSQLHPAAADLDKLPPYKIPVPADFEAPTQSWWPAETLTQGEDLA